MGNFLGYVKLNVSNITLAEGYDTWAETDQYACSSPSNRFMAICECNGLKNYADLESFTISESNPPYGVSTATDDLMALSELIWLTERIGSDTSKWPKDWCPAGKVAQYNQVSDQYPLLLTYDNGSLIAMTYVSSLTTTYYAIEACNGETEVLHGSINPYSMARLLVKVEDKVFAAWAGGGYPESVVLNNKIWTFWRLYGWENATIYDNTDGDIFSLKPFGPRIKRGESIQFEGVFVLAGVDRSNELTWTIGPNTLESYEFYNGWVITSGGRLTAVDPKTNEIVVGCHSPLGAKFTTVTLIESGEDGPTPGIDNPYQPGGGSFPGGGGGSFGRNEVSDDVSADIPHGSTIGNDSATGMYTRYLMNSSYLELLGDWVFDPNLGLSLIVAGLAKIYGNPAESMISLMSFPFSLTAPLQGITSRVQPLYFGHQPTGADYIALTSGAATIDWGTITLEEYWGNFLDYSPHTKIELYLPWGTGFVELDPGQCLPGTLNIITNIEFSRGSCVHNVINKDGCVIGSYTGQPGTLVPLISSDIAAKRAGAVIAAVSLGVGGALTAGSAAMAAAGQTSAMSTYTTMMHGKGYGIGASQFSSSATQVAQAGQSAFNEASTVMAKGARPAGRMASDAARASLRHPASVMRNGGFGDASAGMMVQYPYIILSRPQQDVPENYGHHYGYPSNIYTELYHLRGYTEIASIHLNGIHATDAELTELEDILRGGVIL